MNDRVKDKETKLYTVYDKETFEYITDISEDELFEVVSKRVLDRNLDAFKKLAE